MRGCVGLCRQTEGFLALRVSAQLEDDGLGRGVIHPAEEFGDGDAERLVRVLRKAGERDDVATPDSAAPLLFFLVPALPARQVSREACQALALLEGIAEAAGELFQRILADLRSEDEAPIGRIEDRQIAATRPAGFVEVGDSLGEEGRNVDDLARAVLRMSRRG